MELSQTDTNTNNLVHRDGGQVTEVYSQPSVVGGMASLSIFRQIGVIVGFAVAIAIGVAVALWSQTPDYSLLYGNVSEKDVAEVLEALEIEGVDYRIESSSGAILVSSSAVHEVRMKLAGQGFPRSNSIGFEILDKDTGFGVSQTMESARYQRALEGEISRSIMMFRNVKSARVHLALPKQSVFIRKRKKPSASVLVDLYNGRYLEKGQIEAIVHLVASSVPELNSQHVTVVDQRGNLLNANETDAGLSLSNKQFDYKKQVENHLIERVENILTPLVGSDSMRTQLTADIDFTVTERTQERFNPDFPALRSEQTQEDRSALSAVQGVPGALSNQPPAAGTAPEVGSAGNGSGQAAPTNNSKSSTRNYELDKTIVYSQLATGVVHRLTVAVVIDNRHILQDDGSYLDKPYSEEDKARFTELVKQAIGFDTVRGDRVTVTNAAFMVPETLEQLPELPIWQQIWFQNMIKQLIGVLIALIVILGVLRPVLKGLIARTETSKTNSEKNNTGQDATGALPPGTGTTGSKQLASDKDGNPLLLEAPQSYEKQVEFAQKMVDEDPKRVAQVIKNWVQADD